MFINKILGIFAELPYFFPKIQSIVQSYYISKSLRFKGSSTYLNRTPSVTGNRRVWTWSGWIKRASLGTTQYLYSSFNASTNECSIKFNTDNTLEICQQVSSTFSIRLITTQVFRDASAWFHLIVSADTTQLLDSSRLRVFINGQEIEDFSTSIYPARNLDTNFNLTSYTHQIGAWNTSNFFNGYMTDVYFIDGDSLLPSSFGEINFLTGVWIPKQYSGSYGTNGFNLKFEDNSAASATAIGKDSSGNGNNWTPNNINLITGSNFDSMLDTPTLYNNATYYSGWNPSYGLQFRSNVKCYLVKTLPTGTNNKKWTWSAWIKRSATLASTTILFSRQVVVNSSEEYIGFSPTHNLIHHDGNAGVEQTRTTNTFSDTSVWYHIVYVYDSDNPTLADKGIFYVNGVRQTSSTTNISNARQSFINTSGNHSIGKWYSDIGGGFDGIMSEINFIDGQVITPSLLGETNSSGIWVPKTYTGSYGANGFYLNFANRSAMTQAAIGDDASINNNQWAPNNFLSTDAIDFNATSTLGNYAVLNPLILADITTVTQNGNLSVPAANNAGLFSIPNNIQFYFEVETANNYGICIAKVNPTFEIIFSVTCGYNTTSSPEAYYYRQMFYNSGTGTIDSTNPGGNQIRTGIFGFAVNKNAGTLLIYHNGIQIGSMTLSNPLHMDCFVIRQNSNTIAHTEKHINFGQRPFAYTPPAGYSTLNTNNLPTPTVVNPASYMAATTYTGISAGKSITNTVNSASFKPDLVWIKSRNSAQSHVLTDSVRGVNSQLFSDLVNSHGTQSDQLTSFNLSGFSVGLNTSGTGGVNYNAIDYISWQWKAGGNTSTNTVGSISASVNVDPTAGFSIVSYTGNGNASATVGHGLGVAPSMIICKSRSSGNGWIVYHKNLPANNALSLQSPNPQVAASATSEGIISTSPTNTTFGFTAGTTGVLNVNGTSNIYMAYCFSEIEGYSKFGSYTGNGLDNGPFVYCGFKPRFVMYKSTTEAAGNWQMCDSARSVSNFVNEQLAANTLSASITTGPYIDILSNGFKLRTASSAHNLNGATYIFAAFAEAPSKYALAESSVNLNKSPENIATNSLRFRSSASAYLSRTPSTAGNRKTWTWSGWVKRGLISGSATYELFFGDNYSTSFTGIRFTNDSIRIQDFLSGSKNILWDTSAVFRDPSAWYHIVVKYDTTQASSTNSVLVYVNGVSQTLTFTILQGSYVQNYDGIVNSTNSHKIGAVSTLNYFDGYMTEINFIDGQALSPLAFGEINSVTGVWTPRRYTGSYGNNGFYLKFGNTASLGQDSSGKGNNWTPNNFSTTLGATYDVMTDVPVNYDDGRNGRGNYAVLNPLARSTFAVNSSNPSGGNLTIYNATITAWAEIIATLGVSSGKWYWEIFASNIAANSNLILGVVSDQEFSNLNSSNKYVGSNAFGYGYYSENGNKYNNATPTAYGAAYSNSDVIGVALNMDAGTLTFYKNNVSQGVAFSGLTGLIYPAFSSWSGVGSVNFGQQPFAYTPPAGFKALNTNNLPTPTIINPAEYISATTYTGTGSAQNIRNNFNNVSFQPDLVWLKRRNLADSHGLFDSVRGAGRRLQSNDTTIESFRPDVMTSFNTNGFSISGSDNQSNASGSTYVAWQWKAGSTIVINTSGSITSQVNANPTAGFSIVTYTGNGIAGATIGHGLGVIPSMIIVKSRNEAKAGGAWPTWHGSLNNTNTLYLDQNFASTTYLNRFDPTGFTSSVFKTGSNGGTNSELNTLNNTLVAYCFAEIAGFSKFGSYTGNGVADGPFVFCGFRPMIVIIKNISISADWVIYDTSRNTFNGTDTQLFPNLGNPQSSDFNRLDVTSNGFKLRIASSNEMNQTSNTFIFAAFAEAPFKYSLAR